MHYPSRNIKKEIKDVGQEMHGKLENGICTVNQMSWTNCAMGGLDGREHGQLSNSLHKFLCPGQALKR